jgi:ubiquitin-protein ligase
MELFWTNLDPFSEDDQQSADIQNLIGLIIIFMKITPDVQKRIMKDFEKIQKMPKDNLAFECSIQEELNFWTIRYKNLRSGSQLEKDMTKYKQNTGIDYLEFELNFPPEYPNIPPSIRIVQPALTTEYSGTGVFCFDGIFSSIWNSNTEIDTGLVNAFNYLINDQNPGINFSRAIPHTRQEAQNGATNFRSHKE